MLDLLDLGTVQQIDQTIDLGTIHSKSARHLGLADFLCNHRIPQRCLRGGQGWQTYDGLTFSWCCRQRNSFFLIHIERERGLQGIHGIEQSFLRSVTRAGHLRHIGTTHPDTAVFQMNDYRILEYHHVLP
ncbi:hypothetical protein GT37_03980 [Pseudomonas putida]|nr:hypothetical protein GT37_03980 [Pseudomonas putida]